MYFHPQKFNQIENRTNSFINSLEKLLQNYFSNRSFGKAIIKQSINQSFYQSIDWLSVPDDRVTRRTPWRCFLCTTRHAQDPLTGGNNRPLTGVDWFPDPLIPSCSGIWPPLLRLGEPRTNRCPCQRLTVQDCKKKYQYCLFVCILSEKSITVDIYTKTSYALSFGFRKVCSDLRRWEKTAVGSILSGDRRTFETSSTVNLALFSRVWRLNRSWSSSGINPESHCKSRT